MKQTKQTFKGVVLHNNKLDKSLMKWGKYCDDWHKATSGILWEYFKEDFPEDAEIIDSYLIKEESVEQ